MAAAQANRQNPGMTREKYSGSLRRPAWARNGEACLHGLAPSGTGGNIVENRKNHTCAEVVTARRGRARQKESVGSTRAWHCLREAGNSGQ